MTPVYVLPLLASLLDVTGQVMLVAAFVMSRDAAADVVALAGDPALLLPNF